MKVETGTVPRRYVTRTLTRPTEGIDMNTVRYEARNERTGHTFTFDAPSRSHESIAALTGIGYTVTEIAHLAFADRLVNAFGGRYTAYNVATWTAS